MMKFKVQQLLILFSVVIISCTTSKSKVENGEKPNFLIVTFEDASPYGISAYVTKDVNTSHLDAFAKKGILYTNASSSAPHCSPARSTSITGAFAATFGMDANREYCVTPTDIFYPEVLRANGYFCSNNTKKDYNTVVDNNTMWDECGSQASYWSDKRKVDQPFFAVFNTTATYMGRMLTVTTDGRWLYKDLNIDPAKITIPNYMLDLPAIRSDLAVHLESYIVVDKWFTGFFRRFRSKRVNG